MKACWSIPIVVGLASAGGAQAPSLIVNGSFEEGPAVARFLNLPAGDTSLPGWVVTGEGVDYVSTGYWISADGARAIDLDGSARSRTTPPYVQGGIAQTFKTTPGERYRVTFDLAGNPNQLPRVKRLSVSAAGESTEFTFDATGRTGRNMGWTAQRWTFTATAASTTLEFRSLTVSPQTGFGAAIDNVAVVLEPAAPLDVVETETEIQVNFGAEILFDTGRFDLKPASEEALESLLALLARYPEAPVLIEGHTDSVGTAQSNQVLSENRAAAVKTWLVNHGIAGARITTRGLGQTSPVATNDTADGRQKNRRVEVRIQKTSEARAPVRILVAPMRRVTESDRSRHRPARAARTVQHQDLVAGRWHELSLAEQLGNIGSEVSRAARWQAKNPAVAQGALFRALELFSLTLDDPRHRRSAPRLREIARAREVVADFFAGPNEYGSDALSLQRYFDAYAVMARRQSAGE